MRWQKLTAINNRLIDNQKIKNFVSNPLFEEKTILNSDTSWPKISIVTPSYNQAQFLERTILSVLNQNYPNLEYIIIDGGSTDGTVDIITKYQKYLTYWISERDKGQADALNKGFNIARGELFFYLNSDDILMPNILKKVSTIFVNKPYIDVVYGNKLVISQNDNIISERRVTKWIPFVTKVGLFAQAGYGIYMDAAFWRQKIYKKTQHFDISLKNTMDTDFFLQLVKLNARFYYMKEYVIGFRLFQDSKTIAYGNDVGPKETQILFLKYYPYNYKMPKLLKYLMRMMWGFIFITQGDVDYLFRRFFYERFKNYQQYNYKE